MSKKLEGKVALVTGASKGLALPLLYRLIHGHGLGLYGKKN